MSLQTRLTDLVAAIGADIKAIKSSPDSVSNASVADLTSFNTDSVLTGSAILLPIARLKIGTIYRLRLHVVKTGVGTATPILTIRVGTTGTVTDTSRAALTFAAQTAVADEGFIEAFLTFRAVGATTTGIVKVSATLIHKLAATGLSVENASVRTALSTGFDTTVANSYISASLNAGTNSWTVDQVQAELVNLASS